MHEVYLYGMIAASTVVIIADEYQFPGPNGYAEIQRTLPSIGGEAANSAIVLSKLGLKTKLDGSWLSQQHSGTIIDLLRPFDIDITRLVRREGFGAEEIVISDKTSRTVFGNYAAYNSGERQWNIPQEIDIQNASIVSLDPFFANEAATISEMCVRNQKPYVTIDCRYDDPIHFP
jgi:sugar/nucleoside kinase (ribokinase family)